MDEHNILYCYTRYIATSRNGSGVDSISKLGDLQSSQTEGRLCQVCELGECL